MYHSSTFNYLTDSHLQNNDLLKQTFEHKTGLVFSPHSFREYRLRLLDAADAFIDIRMDVCESSSFELAYHIFNGTRAPVFIACWNKAPLQATLLRELHNLIDVTYATFSSAEELVLSLSAFMEKVRTMKEKNKKNIFLRA